MSLLAELRVDRAELLSEDARAALREPGVDAVEVNEVWTPAWTKARITPEGRETLRTFGVSM